MPERLAARPPLRGASKLPRGPNGQRPPVESQPGDLRSPLDPTDSVRFVLLLRRSLAANLHQDMHHLYGGPQPSLPLLSAAAQAMANPNQKTTLTRITVSVDPSDYKQVEQLARSSGLSTAFLIRQAMKEFLERYGDSASVSLVPRRVK